MKTRKNSVLFPVAYNFYRYIITVPLDRGLDPIVPRWIRLYNIQTPSQSEIGRSVVLEIVPPFTGRYLSW